MSNLLLVSTDWADLQSDNPPTYWNGTAYVQDFTSLGQPIGMGLLYQGDDPVTGDVFAGTMSCTNGADDQPPFGDQPFYIIQNVALGQPQGGVAGPCSVGTPVDFSFDPANGTVLFLSPNPDATDYDTGYHGIVTILPTPDGPPATEYNCDCDDDFPTETLGDMTRRVIVRLGYAAMTIAPPGMDELVKDFLIQAQKLLFRQYKCFRTERWFTWDMPQGQRFFDFGANRDACNKKLDPRLITWVGISQGDNNWRELISGINPVRYTSKFEGLSQWFEVRQCIEVWPAMADSTWQLRIKGIFGLLPFDEDDDVTTIDAEAIFMLALGNAKAHYGQADAGNSISQLQAYIGFLTASNQPRRRFFPGEVTVPNAVPPRIV